MPPAFSAGMLTARIQWQKLREGADAPARNAANEPNLTGDAAYKNAWQENAAIESISGREFLYAQEINAQTTHRLKVWYRPGRSERDRALFTDPVTGKTRKFNVFSVITKEEGRPIYQICLVMEQKDGSQ